MDRNAGGAGASMTGKQKQRGDPASRALASTGMDLQQAAKANPAQYVEAQYQSAQQGLSALISEMAGRSTAYGNNANHPGNVGGQINQQMKATPIPVIKPTQ